MKIFIVEFDDGKNFTEANIQEMTGADKVEDMSNKLYELYDRDFVKSVINTYWDYEYLDNFSDDDLDILASAIKTKLTDDDIASTYDYMDWENFVYEEICERFPEKVNEE